MIYYNKECVINVHYLGTELATISFGGNTYIPIFSRYISLILNKQLLYPSPCYLSQKTLGHLALSNFCFFSAQYKSHTRARDAKRETLRCHISEKLPASDAE